MGRLFVVLEFQAEVPVQDGVQRVPKVLIEVVVDENADAVGAKEQRVGDNHEHGQ